MAGTVIDRECSGKTLSSPVAAGRGGEQLEAKDWSAG
jgi:hypothetical protein